MKIVPVFALFLWLLAAPGCAAQERGTRPEGAAGAQPESVKVERFLRRHYDWPDAINVKVGPFRPSKIPGLRETTVELSLGEQKQELTFLISSDGQYVVQGPVLAMNEDPYAANREKIDLSQVRSLGSPLAPVTLVEYSDFQCSFCRGTAQVLRKELLPEFESQVRFIYKDYPLVQIHPWALPAAQFGQCLGKRYADSFWKFHDWVFATQPQLTTANFTEKALEWARGESLDAGYLGACMEQPEAKAAVEREVAEAQSLGVTGTPTMFINGRKVVGAQPAAQIRRVIQSALKDTQDK